MREIGILCVNDLGGYEAVYGIFQWYDGQRSCHDVLKFVEVPDLKEDVFYLPLQ